MGSYHMVRFSDGYKTTISLSVFDVQLQRAVEDHLVAFGAFSEETETVGPRAGFRQAKRSQAQTGQMPSKDSHGVRRPTGSTAGATTSGSTCGTTTSPGKTKHSRDTTRHMRPLATYYLVLCTAAGIDSSPPSFTFTLSGGHDQERRPRTRHRELYLLAGFSGAGESPTPSWMRQETKTSSRANDLRGLS